MLIEQLIKHSKESHPDYTNLQAAFKLITESAYHINNSIGDQQSLNKILALQERFSGDPGFVAPSRVFFCVCVCVCVCFFSFKV